MTPEQVIEIMQSMLLVTMELCLPVLLVLMTVGVGVSIFQAVTQISEPTLLFIPKLVCGALVLAWIFPWMMKILLRYTADLLIHRWSSLLPALT